MADSYVGVINMATVKDILRDRGFDFGWFEVSDLLFERPVTRVEGNSVHFIYIIFEVDFTFPCNHFFMKY